MSRDDCFSSAPPLTTLAEALAIIAARYHPAAAEEEVDLRAAAHRVLAEDLVASAPLPPCDNAAVDGYAIAWEALAAAGATRLSLAGRAAAGHPFAGTVPSGAAVRILTGAPMPDGCDTVVMQEDCIAGTDAVIVPAGVRKGANRRRAGEDVAAGATVLKRGRRLRPWDLALAAAIGRARIRVYRPLRAAVFSTGDELRAPGEPLAAGEIRDANRYALMALLADFGCTVTDLGIVKDRFEALRSALAAAAAGHDLIVTSGGMSVGEEDHVRAAVDSLGALDFWQLAIKPGRPIGVGSVAGVPFLGLPGNPVAMVVVMLRIARPLILRLAGASEPEPRSLRVAADFAFDKKAGRREWLRASLVEGAGGAPVLRRFPREGSGILTSLVDSDGLIELAEQVTRVEPGTAVDFFPFSAFR